MATVEYEGVVYQVVERELPEGDKPLVLPPPTRKFEECDHSKYRRAYWIMDWYDKTKSPPIYKPGGAVESPGGRFYVCEECHAVSFMGAEWTP